MATFSLSLLLLRRRRLSSLSLRRLSSLPLSSPQNPNSISSSDSPPNQDSNSDSPPNRDSNSGSKPPSLSSRLSFVFDQLDSLSRPSDHLSSHDSALRQIRSWSNQNNQSVNQTAEAQTTENRPSIADSRSMSEVLRKEVELVHPWPEWIELMERLAEQSYFEVRRGEEAERQLAADVAVDLAGVEEPGPELDFTRDWRTVKNACWNFSRDRFDIIRKLQRKDIEVLVGRGCPSMDQKTVFSAKLLRKLVHLNEGDVCSSCTLRQSCSRGYILTPKEDEARTLDIMRILLTFGFHPINGSVENEDLLRSKPVKTVARKLMHEVVRLSQVAIDPDLVPPVVRKPVMREKTAPPPPRKKRIGREDVEMKKGDWVCPKCDFMNFAKNTVCLQCDAKRPKRQLLPGEWECPRCKFLNYRRNMACYECDNQRPPDEYTASQANFRETGRPVRAQPTRLPEVSDAWNFDFDENESDGADVAAFEFADSSNQGFEREYESNVRERRPGLGEVKPDPFRRETGRTGFDDFDDEDDDDLDSYEIMKGGSGNGNGNGNGGVVRKSFSELENDSDPDDYNEFARGGKRNIERDYFNNPSDNEGEEIVKRSYGGSRNGDKRGGKRMDSDDEFESGSDADFNDGFDKSKGRGRGRVPFDDLESEGEEQFPSRKNDKLVGRNFGSKGDFGRSREKSRSYDDDLSDEEESWNRGRGNNGGFRGRKDDSFGNNGGFRGRKDDSFGNNGGFRGRKDDSFGNNGGFRGRKDESFGRNGGFRGRKDDSFSDDRGFRGRKDDSFGNNGGFRGRKDDSFGNNGGFRGQRDDSFGNKGGFRGRKDDSFDNNGGFRGRKDDSFGNNGGFRGRKDSRSDNGGFRGRSRDEGFERGRSRDKGFERGRSNGDRSGFGSRNRGGNDKSFGRDKFDDRPQRRANMR